MPIKWGSCATCSFWRRIAKTKAGNCLKNPNISTSNCLGVPFEHDLCAGYLSKGEKETPVKRSKLFEQLYEEQEQTPEYWSSGSMIEIAEKITECLKATGLTKNALSKQLQVNRSYITRIMQGKENLTLQTISKIFLALGYGATLSVSLKKIKRGVKKS